MEQPMSDGHSKLQSQRREPPAEISQGSFRSPSPRFRRWTIAAARNRQTGQEAIHALVARHELSSRVAACRLPDLASCTPFPSLDAVTEGGPNFRRRLV